MIVVDPDQIIGQQQRCQCSGKRCIHSKVSHEVVAPEFGLRQRPLCGQTILWGLQPAEFDHWESGWLYNPDDGKTYRVRAELRSADSLVARIYLGIPFSGETWTLLRVPRLSSEGWW
jgi:uncharacterized protein (DUF2147 family)